MELQIAYTEIRTRREDGDFDTTEFSGVYVIPHDTGYYLIYPNLSRRIYFLNDKGLYDNAPFARWNGNFGTEKTIFMESHKVILEMKKRVCENKSLNHLEKVYQFSHQNTSSCCTALCVYKDGDIDGYIDFLYPKFEPKHQSIKIFEEHIFEQLENIYFMSKELLDDMLDPTLKASRFIDYYKNHKGFRSNLYSLLK